MCIGSDNDDGDRNNDNKKPFMLTTATRSAFLIIPHQHVATFLC